LATADRLWSALSPRARTAAAALLLAVATLPVLSRQNIGKTQGDLSVYMSGVDALLQGRLYDGHVFEYPPYALIWFLVPHAWAAGNLERFRWAFGLEIWLFDAAIKAALLWRALRGRDGFPDLVPFFVYSLGSAALGHVLLMRYDAIPGALSLAGVLAVAGGLPLVGGAVTALAAGTKAYPALFIPILAIAAWQQGRRAGRRFVIGVAAAMVPLFVLAGWMPWWNFVAFHDERGLEAGSLVASLIWSLHRFAGVDATWSLGGTSNEVGGPLAGQLLAPARLFWVASTLAALGLAIAGALRMPRRREIPPRASSIGMLMLLTVVAFVATNTVLSPQFHLWLIPLAALMLEDRAALPSPAVRAAWLVFVATMIVPTFFPHRQFGQGLGPALTVLLVLRNLLLVYATVSLFRAASAWGQAAEPSNPEESGRLV
jgi:uncharacterized membrane protein